FTHLWSDDVSAKRRPYTSRPRSGEREGPIAEQWEGEGHPCYLFLRRRAARLPPFHVPLCTKGPGAPHPPNADALGPSLSPLSRGEVYRRSPDLPAKMYYSCFICAWPAMIFLYAANLARESVLI